MIHLKQYNMLIDNISSVYLKNVSRAYGSEKVIENLNLSLHKGKISAILGASGCGKTTLLKIILGKLIPDKGKVFVFGHQPHSFNKNSIPGSNVGYSPQEVALYNEITIGETLEFFATIHQMSIEDFNQRKENLIELLDLPPMNKIVGELSGGQKRRVSLAAALLHNPKLLILDEPTVGVDPLIRARIWSHLRDLAAKGVTVIITTHYIEETKMADTVFFMRNGKFLENGEPNYLLNKYDSKSLEDVFLMLCRTNELPKELTNTMEIPINNSSSNSNNNFSISGIEEVDSFTLTPGDEIEDQDNEINNSNFQNFCSFAKRKSKHTLAILKRKLIQLIRIRIVLLFEIFSPAFQIVLYFLCIGGIPRNLNFGVINNDVSVSGGWDFHLGNDLVGYLSQSNIFDLHFYNDTDYAINLIKKGKLWGLIDIPKNFSSGLSSHYMDPIFTPLQEESMIKLYMDFTNYQITETVYGQFQLSLEKLGSQFNITSNPVQIQPGIYGDIGADFLWFLAPGMVALICFANSIGLTSVSFVREKNDGTLDRLYAYNVSTSSIILGHLLSSFVVLFVQSLIMIILSIYAFQIPNEGNIILVFFIVMANGFVAMALGLVISALSNVEVEAIQMTIVCFFPTLILSGTLWPAEGIKYKWLKIITSILPTTHASSALRDIMVKGCSISYPEVYQAILIILAWFIALFTFAAVSLKKSDKNLNFKKFLQNIKKKITK